MALLLAPPSMAQEQPPLSPSESVWRPAPAPPGGVPWSVLESTKEVARRDSYGSAYSAPEYSPAVQALAGTRIKVSGYMLPLQNSERQSHFILLAYPRDCPFHMNPGPAQFLEVTTKTPVAFDYEIRNFEGVLELVGEDGSGTFYRLTGAAGF